MRVFETYAALSAALTLAADAPGAFRFKSEFMPAGFRCEGCQRAVLFMTECGTGYARTVDNGMICYACADKRQAADMAAHTSGPFHCYMDRDGRNVTTWTGGYLGRVLRSNSSRSGWHGSEVWRFRVRDAAGWEWNGRGAGPGRACTLRLAAVRKPRADERNKGV